MGPHRGPLKIVQPPNDKLLSPVTPQGWSNRPSHKLKPKKVFLGEDIREKEVKLGPHRGTTTDGPPSGT